jgi:hypothetical protein
MNGLGDRFQRYSSAPTLHEHLRSTISAGETLHVIVHFEFAAAICAVQVEEVFGHSVGNAVKLSVSGTGTVSDDISIRLPSTQSGHFCLCCAIIPNMPTEHIVQLLIAERDRLNEAIALLGGGTTKRRGRPPRDALANAPAWVLPKSKIEKKKRKRMFTAKQRADQAARMKAYWKAKKAGSKRPKKAKKAAASEVPV